MSDPHPRYEVVIGLEVHTHLRTDSKLFSSAPVRYGDAPNHDVTAVCLALPGSLPVLNERAVELAIRTGLALHCTVQPRSIFARKNYFYPDLPKGYQISQYEDPICTGGWLEIEVDNGGGDAVSRRIALTRVHMEEDAGKSVHEKGRGAGSLVDLNRAGVPLLEIVSEPELRSPAEASAYLRTLRSILRYIDVSEADMEKGQFRCDANVSLRAKGARELGTRTELKNLNSFRFVEQALEREIERHAAILDEGGAVEQATFLFDPDTGETHSMRGKENADDYRYFPDPDLIPLVFDASRIDAARASLPELPRARRERFESEYGLSPYDARQLTQPRALADWFEDAVRSSPDGGEVFAKNAANWIQRDVLAVLREQACEIEDAALTPDGFAALLGLVDAGTLTAKSARALLPVLLAEGGDPAARMREQGLEAVSDAGVLETAADAVLAANVEQVAKYRAGETKMLNFLMGRVMRETGGKADPATVRAMLERKLADA